MPVTPSTDPDERNYRIRLLPRVMTPMRQRHGHRQTYLLQFSRRVCSARCPGRVLLAHVPRGQSPSLHLLRHRLPGFVRKLLRYYGTVRLPVPVHRRRMSLGLSRRGLRLFSPRRAQDLPVLEQRCFRTCLGSLTSREPSASRHSDASDIAFRFHRRRRLPEVALFRGSIPSLHVPLSTLRPLLTEFAA